MTGTPRSAPAVDGSRPSRLTEAQAADLRRKGRDELIGAVVLVGIWLLASVFGYFAGGRFVMIGTALIAAALFLVLAALRLRTGVQCLLDAGSAPAVLEGELKSNRHTDRRGKTSVTITVGGQPVVCSAARWERFVAPPGQCLVYAGARSRLLLAVEPLTVGGGQHAPDQQSPRRERS
jgi:hypothetical protein